MELDCHLPAVPSSATEVAGGPLWICNTGRCSRGFLKARSLSSRSSPVPAPGRFPPKKRGRTCAKPSLGDRSQPGDGHQMTQLPSQPHALMRPGPIRPGNPEVAGSSPLAGNTTDRPARARLTPVHPRARGEHADHFRNTPSVPGSSPRSRGTPLRRPGCHLSRRFIPALAGNTRQLRHLSHTVPVHPRARGEHAY